MSLVGFDQGSDGSENSRKLHGFLYDDRKFTLPTIICSPFPIVAIHLSTIFRGQCLFCFVYLTAVVFSDPRSSQAFYLPSRESYSYRRATSGSTFVARRAGNQQAIKATNVSSEAMTSNVTGSVTLTP